jgi:hypothetical protein
MTRGARLDQLAELYHQSGPFATAYVEVSRDAESGNQVAELSAARRRRAAGPRCSRGGRRRDP